VAKKAVKTTKRPAKPGTPSQPDPVSTGVSPEVIDRLWDVVMARRDADTAISHSARLLSRGTAKVAQKFGEEAVECIIEAVAGTQDALVASTIFWCCGCPPACIPRKSGPSSNAVKASAALPKKPPAASSPRSLQPVKYPSGNHRLVCFFAGRPGSALEPGPPDLHLLGFVHAVCIITGTFGFAKLNKPVTADNLETVQARVRSSRHGISLAHGYH
jgi:phosphoribosyl-ATP pyrophosphohydrolase